MQLYRSLLAAAAPQSIKIVVRISKDRGLTWQVGRVFGTAHLTGQGGIARLPSGRILNMMSDISGHDEPNYHEVWKSDDNGLTWQVLSQRYPWTDVWSWGNIARLTCDGGKLMTSWNNGGAWGFATSRDSGASWSRTTHTAQHHLFGGAQWGR